jgi:hypothetical protein
MFNRLFTKLMALFRRRPPVDDPWLRSPYGRILLEARHSADELVKRYRNATE